MAKGWRRCGVGVAVVLACGVLMSTVALGQDKPKRKQKEKQTGPVENAQYYASLANVYARFRHYDKAMETVDEALAKAENEKEKAKIQLMKARVLAAQGKKDEAAALAGQIAAATDDPHVLAAASHMMAAGGNMEQALESMRNAYEKQPDNAGLTMQLIHLYLKADRADDAMALAQRLRDAAKTDTEKSNVLFIVANISWRQKDTAAAKQSLEQIKQLPDVRGSHKRADRMLQMIEKAKQKKERPAKAPKSPKAKKAKPSK